MLFSGSRKYKRAPRECRTSGRPVAPDLLCVPNESVPLRSATHKHAHAEFTHRAKVAVQHLEPVCVGEEPRKRQSCPYYVNQQSIVRMSGRHFITHKTDNLWWLICRSFSAVRRVEISRQPGAKRFADGESFVEGNRSSMTCQLWFFILILLYKGVRNRGILS